MAWVLPEVSIRRVIDDGMRRLRTNKAAFLEIFSEYIENELGSDYGTDYVESIWDWFSTTKIPVIQSWSFNVQKIPCISVHLANEQEAEDKVSFDDYAGTFEEDTTTGTGVFTVMLDIGLHATKGGDHVLWLYYITSYILFKSKLTLERFGLKTGTFNASDYSKDAEKMGNNIWTRWIRYRCTTQNFWGAEDLTEITDLETDATISLAVATDVATTPDVDVVDLNSSSGITVSRVGIAVEVGPPGPQGIPGEPGPPGPPGESGFTLQLDSQNANGLVLTDNILSLTAASALLSGAITTGAQTIAGNKTFTGSITSAGLTASGLVESTSGGFKFPDGTTQTTAATGSGGGTPSGSAGAIQFSGGATFASDETALFWDNANNRLGIGTNSPASPLTVLGVIESTSGGFKFPDGTTQITAGGGGSSSGVTGAIQFSGGAGAFTSDATNLFWDDTNNRLGIGTATPEVSLTVKATQVAGGPELRLINSSANAVNNLAKLSFVVDGGLTAGPNVSLEAIATDVDGTTDLVFKTWDGAILGEIARLTNSGLDVGFKVTSPGFGLRDFADPNTFHAFITYSGVGSGNALFDDTVQFDSYKINGLVFHNDSGPWKWTSGTKITANERMRLTAAGDLGIGTASPNSKLEVAGTIHSTSGGFKFPDGTTQITASSGGSSSGAAGAIQFSGGSGAFASDAANLFWDDVNNRLGIGTNSPSAPLQVLAKSTNYRNLGVAQLQIQNGVSGAPGLLMEETETGFVGNIGGISFYHGEFSVWNKAGAGNAVATDQLLSITTSAVNVSSGKNFSVDSNVLFVDATNNRVGAGIANPYAGQLMVSAAGGSGIGGDLWINNSTGTPSAGIARLAFASDGSTDATPNWGIESQTQTGGGSQAQLVFKAWDGSGYNEKARITQSGVFSATTGSFTNLSVSSSVTTNLLLSPSGSSQASPRTLGVSTFSSGQAARWTFGDSANALQLGFGTKLQMYAFHGVEISGGTGSSSAPAFITGGGNADISLKVNKSTGSTVSVRTDGIVESTSGGFKFPDATIQTTAATAIAGAASGATHYARKNGFSPNETKADSTWTTILSTTYMQTSVSQPVVIRAHGSLFSTVGSTVARFRVLYDGVASEDFPVGISGASESEQYAMTWQVTGTATTGAKTVALQWSRGSGTGTLTMNTDNLAVMTIDSVGTSIASGAITLAVATTGSDSPTGGRLAAKILEGDYSADPFATLAGAFGALPTIRPYPVTIAVGAGTFTGPIVRGFIDTGATNGGFTLKGTTALVTLTTGSNSGTAGTGTTSTSLQKPTAAANWTVNELIGKLVRITVGSTEYVRTIRANTGTTATVQSVPGMDNTSTFQIVSISTLLQEISGTDLVALRVTSNQAPITLRYLKFTSAGSLDALIESSGNSDVTIEGCELSLDALIASVSSSLDRKITIKNCIFTSGADVKVDKFHYVNVDDLYMNGAGTILVQDGSNAIITGVEATGSVSNVIRAIRLHTMQGEAISNGSGATPVYLEEVASFEAVGVNKLTGAGNTGYGVEIVKSGRYTLTGTDITGSLGDILFMGRAQTWVNLSSPSYGVVEEYSGSAVVNSSYNKAIRYGSVIFMNDVDVSGRFLAFGYINQSANTSIPTFVASESYNMETNGVRGVLECICNSALAEVLLPSNAAIAGVQITIVNRGSQTLTVKPPVGGTVNGGASVTISAGTAKLFVSLNGNGGKDFWTLT